MNVLDAIDKYNLSVRKIPAVITQEWHTWVDGEKITTVTTKVPKHAGDYMVQSIKHNDAQIRWNHKAGFTAKTLKASIQLYLRSINVWVELEDMYKPKFKCIDCTSTDKLLTVLEGLIREHESIVWHEGIDSDAAMYAAIKVKCAKKELLLHVHTVELLRAVGV